MAPSQPTTDAFVPHRRFTTLRFLLHLRLQRDEEEPMADLRVRMYGAWWSYGAALAVRKKGCLVATTAPSRNPRVLSA
ncbi:hypothetical protein ERO13_A11G276700v2 [Gossypium hirsutum]|uniref:Uncharacterized protein n=1 Tax=Gossypium tomentosum TaxID=34277 RepID=A0A5D2NGF1_GOSTO|nr:hypothetical protein ERO13_A11G276700v2 [Gossypium hirsutum]TYI03197.1 hypothetical protein ES332_A11G319600v1 [Gossypium tomentosum]